MASGFWILVASRRPWEVAPGCSRWLLGLGGISQVLGGSSWTPRRGSWALGSGSGVLKAPPRPLEVAAGSRSWLPGLGWWLLGPWKWPLGLGGISQVLRSGSWLHGGGSQVPGGISQIFGGGSWSMLVVPRSWGHLSDLWRWLLDLRKWLSVRCKGLLGFGGISQVLRSGSWVSVASPRPLEVAPAPRSWLPGLGQRLLGPWQWLLGLGGISQTSGSSSWIRAGGSQALEAPPRPLDPPPTTPSAAETRDSPFFFYFSTSHKTKSPFTSHFTQK